MNILQLVIDAGWPEQHTDCDWQLLDPAGRLLEKGRSEPRHWPGVAPTPGAPRAAAPAPQCELILSADQATCMPARLPPGAAGRRVEVIAYAVEDRLIEEADACHFVAGARRTDGATDVIVINRARLRAILAALSGVGLAPARAAVEAELLDPPDEGWCLKIERGAGCLRTADTWLHLDALAADAPPALLSWAMGQDGAPACRRLRVTGADAPSIAAERWSHALGIEIEVRAGAGPGQIPARAANLLQGEFAPPRAHHAAWRHYRAAAFIAVAGLAAWFAASLGEWGWLAWQAAALRTQQIELYRATFPQGGSLVSAPLQMQRSVDAERARRGLAGETDFLSLLALLASAQPLRIDELRYEAHRLNATLTLPQARALDELRRALGERGVRLDVAESGAAGSGLRARVALTKGGL